MNRDRVLRKNWSRWLVSAVSLLLLACVSEESFQARPSPALTPLARPKVKLRAELITAHETQQSPRFRSHLGQILLAREGLQLVVPVLSLLNESPSHYSLLSQVYRLQRRSWQMQSWLPLPEISLRTADGDILQLVGRDIESTSDVARVVSLFRSSKVPALEAKLTMSFTAASPALEVEIQSLQGQPLFWDVRIRRGVGEELAIPFVQESLAGMSLALLPDVFSLVSSTPLGQESDAAYLHLKNLEAAPRSGFYLLLDKAAIQLQTSLVAQALACYQNKEAAASLDCLRPAWNPPSYWTVTQSNGSAVQKGERRLSRPLYIHNSEGAFRSVLPIQEGERVKLGLSPLETFEIYFPDGEGVLTHKKPEGPISTLDLPEIQRGTLNLELNPRLASFVEIRDEVHSQGISIQSLLNIRGFPAISPHTILQKTWPLNAELPAGDYHIQVFNGKTLFCQQRITIRKGKKHQIPCQLEAPQQDLSARASLSLDPNRFSKEMLQAASMDIFARDSRLPTGAAHEISILEVTDPSLGLSLKAFPADEAIRVAWQSLRSHGDASPLQEFVNFARAQKPPLLLVLECPAAGFLIEEYRWLSLAFQPDFLEVFGCQQAQRSAELIGVAHQLQQKSSKAIKLAVASPLRSLYQLHGQVPAMYMPLSKAGRTRDEQLEDLQLGAYSLGLRSEIEVEGLGRPQVLKASARELSLLIRSHELKKAGGLIRIHDQSGLLLEHKLPASPLFEQQVNIPLSLQGQNRWLRVELLGPDGPGKEASTDFLLATTNFLRVSPNP